VQRAIAAHGVPEIFNTDQGCQFTSAEFTQPLLELGVRLSMDGKGRCLDNVFVERLWRSLKHEEVYLKRYESVVDAQQQIGAYLAFCNDLRPHSAHGHATPNEVYHAHPQTKQAA
jgi:putative transposase